MGPEQIVPGDSVVVNGETQEVKSVNGETTDIHRARAAKEFGVPYEQVTPEQRRAGKALNFGELYGMGQKPEPETDISAVMGEAPAPPAESPEQMAERVWGELVSGVIRKSKNLPANAPINMPAPEGRYVKYAYAANGTFATPKAKGKRLRPHMSPQMRYLAVKGQQFLMRFLEEAFDKAKADAKAASTEENKVDVKPITQEVFNQCQIRAAEAAANSWRKRTRDDKKAARKRHRDARRVGFGLVSYAKGIHAGA